MAGNFMEQLLSEWYKYRGYIVRTNEPVGKREGGGYEGELDVLALHPVNHDFVHIETSTDAESWEKREVKFRRKFEKGKKYAAGLFPGLIPEGTEPQQVTVLVFAAIDKRKEFAGAKLLRVSDVLAEIMNEFASFPMTTKQVPGKYTILRALQFLAHYRDGVLPEQPNERMQPTRERRGAKGDRPG